MARASSRTRVCCCAEAVERREESGLLGQVAGVTGPPLRQRSRREHADATGAIHRRHLADARRASRGVVILHVMAEPAVMDHVVQHDRAVVPRAQSTLLLDGGILRRALLANNRRHVYRHHAIVVHRQAIERGWGSIKQVVQVRRDGARVIGNRDVANRRVRPGHEIAGNRHLAAGMPRALEGREVVVSGGMVGSQLLLNRRPTARRERARPSLELGRLRLQRVACFGQQGVDRCRAPVTTAKKQAKEVRARDSCAQSRRPGDPTRAIARTRRTPGPPPSRTTGDRRTARGRSCESCGGRATSAAIPCRTVAPRRSTRAAHATARRLESREAPGERRPETQGSRACAPRPTRAADRAGQSRA